MKSIKSALAKFNKSTLKQTTTHVTNVDGSTCLETGPVDAKLVKDCPEKRTGYVIDVAGDLQVGEILPGLILGSQDLAHDIDTLKKYAVSHILNVATGVPNVYPELCTYKNITLLDDPSCNISKHFDKTNEFIDLARSDGCCLVHCNAGISRASTIVIAYVMKTERKSFKSAYEYVKSRRPVICPNPGFVAQLKNYDKILNTS